jgi:hypothetical protein
MLLQAVDEARTASTTALLDWESFTVFACTSPYGTPERLAMVSPIGASNGPDSTLGETPMNACDTKNTDAMQPEELDRAELDRILGGLVGEKHNGFVLGTGSVADLRKGDGYTLDDDTWN